MLNNKEKKKINKAINEIKKYSRYTADELSLLVSAFYDSDETLYALRRLFLGEEPKKGEEIYLGDIGEKGSLMEVIKKVFLPKIDSEAPLMQMTDLWKSNDMKEALQKLPEDAYLDMCAGDILIKYFKQRFSAMEGRAMEGMPIKLEDLVFNPRKDQKQAYIELKARNMILTHIDSHLEEIRMLAISNADVPQSEKQNKISRDSNK